jgi:hypothetical protein
MKTTKESDNVKTDNKLVKLVKLFIAVTCAIASYFLIFSVASDMKYVLWVVATGPALTAGWLIYKNWLG